VPYAPQPDDLIPIFINDNSVGEITFKWRPKTTAIAYELWLATDADFAGLLLKKTITVENRRAPAWRLTDKTGITPGHTYYWKVRIIQAATGETGTGDWSETFPFTVAENTVRRPAESISAENKTPAAAAQTNQPTTAAAPDILKEVWFWQIGAAFFLVLAISIIIILLFKRSRRL
jgi:hypothetical protein